MSCRLHTSWASPNWTVRIPAGWHSLTLPPKKPLASTAKFEKSCAPEASTTASELRLQARLPENETRPDLPALLVGMLVSVLPHEISFAFKLIFAFRTFETGQPVSAA